MQDSNRPRPKTRLRALTAFPKKAGLTALILSLGFAAMLALNLPGQLSYDSVMQLSDGRAAHYNSWHPAIMAWLLGLFDSIVPGSGLSVLFDAALLAGAFFLLLRRNAGWGAAAAALAIILTPQFLLFQGIVWKDILFANAFVLAFAALARAGQEGGRMRLGLFILFFSALSLAALTRQNGLVLLPAGAVAFGWTTANSGLRRGVLHGAGAFALLLAIVAGANFLLSLRSDGGEGLRDEIQMAQIYDLTGAVKQGYRLDLLSRSDPTLAKAIETDGRNAYSLQLQDTLEPFLPAEIPKGVVMAQWQALLLHHPLLYLRERLPVFWQVLATPDVGKCHPGYAGIDGDPAQLQALGLTRRQRPRDIGLLSYARRFIGTPVLSHLAFAALALGLMTLYLRRRGPGDRAMAVMLAGAIVFTASFFFVSVACDYRYLYGLDLTAMLGLFHVFAAPARN